HSLFYKVYDNVLNREISKCQLVKKLQFSLALAHLSESVELAWRAPHIAFSVFIVDRGDSSNLIVHIGGHHPVFDNLELTVRQVPVLMKGFFTPFHSNSSSFQNATFQP
ncbi:hypothetical protein GOP47_0017082, partial [Adiantum capillus-veneris]